MTGRLTGRRRHLLVAGVGVMIALVSAVASMAHAGAPCTDRVSAAFEVGGYDPSVRDSTVSATVVQLTGCEGEQIHFQLLGDDGPLHDVLSATVADGHVRFDLRDIDDGRLIAVGPITGYEVQVPRHADPDGAVGGDAETRPPSRPISPTTDEVAVAGLVSEQPRTGAPDVAAEPSESSVTAGASASGTRPIPVLATTGARTIALLLTAAGLVLAGRATLRRTASRP